MEPSSFPQRPRTGSGARRGRLFSIALAWSALVGIAVAAPGPAGAPTDPAVTFFSPPAAPAAGLAARAQAGQVQAQLALARAVYAQGHKDQALNWLTEANQQGDAQAQYLLGVLYLRGDGVSQDFDQGRYFLGKAAAQNYAPAQYALAQSLLDSEFDDADEDPAQWRSARQRGLVLLRAAAAQGYATAQYRLGLWCARAGSDCAAQAVEELAAAADQGVIDAAYMVGVVVARGVADPGQRALAQRELRRVIASAPAGSAYARQAAELLEKVARGDADAAAKR